MEVEALVLEEDPLNLLYRALFAVALQHAGRLKEAEAELRKVLEVDGDLPLAVFSLGLVCAQQGRFEEALALAEKAYILQPEVSPVAGQLGALLVRAGAAGRAEALIDKVRSGGYGAPTALAVFHALSGQFDQAAAWTERAIDERYPRLIPILGPFLRPTPHWPALAKRMNLPS